MRRNVILAACAALLLVLLLSFPASAAGPCPGGRCAVGQKATAAVAATTRATARATTRIVTAPVRVVRRLGR